MRFSKQRSTAKNIGISFSITGNDNSISDIDQTLKEMKAKKMVLSITKDNNSTKYDYNVIFKNAEALFTFGIALPQNKIF